MNLWEAEGAVQRIGGHHPRQQLRIPSYVRAAASTLALGGAVVRGIPQGYEYQLRVELAINQAIVIFVGKTARGPSRLEGI